jgi:hypothetical protein
MTWVAPVLTGGSPVIDYRIYYDQGIPSASTFTILDSNILATTYTASSMTMGLTYRFMISARNSVGYGTLSSAVSMLAA